MFYTFVYFKLVIRVYILRYLYRTFLFIYMLYRQMYTVLCYLTQFLLNVAQHVSSLYKAHLRELFC
jgi:hypothetical protein